MRNLSVIAFALTLAACQDDSTAPLIDCTEWRTCEGALKIQAEIQSTSRHPAGARYLPGDTVILRTFVENRASMTSDTFDVHIHAPGVGYGYMFEVVLAPGERIMQQDTFRVQPYNFGLPAQFDFDVYSYVDGSEVNAEVSAPRIDLVSSGYAFEVVTPPGQPLVFQRNGTSISGSRLRYRMTNSIGLMLSNPYELPLNGMTFGVSLWQNGNAFERLNIIVPDTVQPNREVFVDLEFFLPSDMVAYEWWREEHYGLVVCGESAINGRHCRGFDVLLAANFEQECPVETLTFGVDVSVAAPTCVPSPRGSVFRFNARAGERYRATLNSVSGTIFFAHPNGVPEEEIASPELTAAADGTYYLVIRHNEPVSFRVDRL